MESCLYQLKDVTVLMLTENVCNTIRVRLVHLTTIAAYHLHTTHTDKQQQQIVKVTCLRLHAIHTTKKLELSS